MSTVTTGIIEVPGAGLAYDTVGSGPPLLLVHAGITDRRMWDDTWLELAKKRRVIRYDTRGFGESRIREPVEFSNRRDLVAVLDHLGVERAAVVGVSRAGQIAIDTAIEYPDRFVALVPVAGGVSGYAAPMTPQEQAMSEEMDRLETTGDWAALNELAMRLWVDGLAGTPERTPEVRRRALEMNRVNLVNQATGPAQRPIVLQPPAAERLSEIKAPTLAIVGDLDAPEAIAYSEYIRDRVAGARLVVMSGVAHLPPMERPAEFVRILEGFLDEVGA